MPIFAFFARSEAENKNQIDDIPHAYKLSVLSIVNKLKTKVHF
jgi:hypothetical protein